MRRSFALLRFVDSYTIAVLLFVGIFVRIGATEPVTFTYSLQQPLRWQRPSSRWFHKNTK